MSHLQFETTEIIFDVLLTEKSNQVIHSIQFVPPLLVMHTII